MNEYIFKVADCYFAVRIPATWSVARLLPSFRPFLASEVSEAERLFTLEVSDQLEIPEQQGEKVVEDSTNDLGHVQVMEMPEGFFITVSYDAARKKLHALWVNRSFSQGRAKLLYEDATAGVALTSMLRMMFAQTILPQGGISVHASCVCKQGTGYLFLGKSGTGKSTHSEQWMKAFDDCSLLNDDNPIVRIFDEKVWVYGSPWSGKKSCYRQENYPVGGIVRLNQAPANIFQTLTETNAFLALLPSCSVLRSDSQLQQVLYGSLIRLTETVPIGTLACLPNEEAARLCYQQLKESVLK